MPNHYLTLSVACFQGYHLHKLKTNLKHTIIAQEGNIKKFVVVQTCENCTLQLIHTHPRLQWLDVFILKLICRDRGARPSRTKDTYPSALDKIQPHSKTPKSLIKCRMLEDKSLVERKKTFFHS